MKPLTDAELLVLRDYVTLGGSADEDWLHFAHAIQRRQEESKSTGKSLTLHLPGTLPTVERALVEEIMDGLMEYVHGEDISNLAHARLALGVLYGYVDGQSKIPATHDGSGEVMGHGRCVV